MIGSSTESICPRLRATRVPPSAKPCRRNWRRRITARSIRTCSGRFSIPRNSCTTTKGGALMNHFDRRGFLKIGAIAPWCYLSWGDVLRAQAKPKKDLSVIHLFLQGGLSQMDSFDPKPESDAKYRSVFKTIPTKLPGVHFTEHLPLTAKQADKFVLIRSMTHKKSAHGEAVTLLLTGHDALPTLQPPAMGSVVQKELGPRNELPGYVWIPQSPGNSSRAGFLGATFNPFNAGEANVPKYAVRDLDLPMGVDWSRMEGRYSLLSLVDSKISQWDTGSTFASIDSYYQSALDLMRSPR